MKTNLMIFAIAIGFAQVSAATEPEPPVSNAEVKKTVEAHLADVRACAGKHGAATGKLVVRFAIEPDGTVKQATPMQASSNGALDKCIAAAFTKWTWPKPKGGVLAGEIYPFVFTVPASLEKDQIADTVKAHIPDVKFCYDEALKKKPDVEGEVDVTITVLPTGAVSDVKKANTTAKFPPLEDCLVTKVKAWQFPKPAGTGNFVFTYPFQLTVPKKEKKAE
jgi:outer membrane biosynthesis protein TonB